MPSKDGKKLFVVSRTFRGGLVRYDSKAGRFMPFASGLSAGDVAFSNDGHSMTYVTYPEGDLWRSKVGGSERALTGKVKPLLRDGRRQLLTNPLPSPDGKCLGFGFGLAIARCGCWTTSNAGTVLEPCFGLLR